MIDGPRVLVVGGVAAVALGAASLLLSGGADEELSGLPLDASPAIAEAVESVLGAQVAGGVLNAPIGEPPATAPPATTTTTAATTVTAAPATTAAPAAVPSGECGGLIPMIQKYWPTEQTAKVCSVIACESGFNPQAQNPRSSASGILQFLDGTWRSARQHVPGASQYARAAHAPVEIQIAVGADWWSRTSWSQWECA